MAGKTTVGRMLVGALVVMRALGGPAPVGAQTRPDERVWAEVTVFGHAGHDSPWHWTTDSLVRSRDGADTLDVLAGGVLVWRDLTRRSNAGLGYIYGASFTDRATLREHRFIQHVGWSVGTKPRVTVRSRLEERFVTGQDAVVVRTRQQLRVIWPISTRRGLSAVAWDEVFAQLNDTSQVSRGFESNVVFLGLRQRLTPRSAAEVGYVSANAFARAGATGRRSHVLSATLLVLL